MKPVTDMQALRDRALRFQQLHDADETFIMANAWNAGSAAILAEAGIAAIGTTSAGAVSYTHLTLPTICSV